MGPGFGGPFARGFGYGMFGGYGFMWILGIILIGTLLFFMMRRTRYNGNNHHGYNNGKSLEILKTRYAKGEITEEEYQRMKKTILEE